jgi:hypothetical protein
VLEQYVKSLALDIPKIDKPEFGQSVGQLPSPGEVVVGDGVPVSKDVGV